MARTEEIALKIKTQTHQKIIINERRQVREAIEERASMEQEVKANRAWRQEVVAEKFIRSPRCWNVYGTGSNGKLGGCDGIHSTCQVCFEYNAEAFIAAKVELEKRMILNRMLSMRTDDEEM